MVDFVRSLFVILLIMVVYSSEHESVERIHMKHMHYTYLVPAT